MQMTTKSPQSSEDSKVVDRRMFMKDLAVGGAAVLATGAALGSPRDARACPGDGGSYGEVVSVGAPVAIGELKSLKVTCLSEVGWWDTNKFLADINAGGGMSASQWGMPFDPKNSAGYSALIEAEECDGTVHTLLLDTGWNVPYMKWVFEREGVAEKLQYRVVDQVILSHEHLDHLWGLPALTSFNRRLPLYVPSTLSAEAWKFMRRNKYHGHVTQIAPGTIHKHFPGCASTTFDLSIILGIRGEQVLYFNVKDKGLVIVTGCGHCGIGSAIDFARMNIVTETGKFHGLFGGLHIAALESWGPAGEAALDAMEAAQFEKVASNHCTGVIAVEHMIERNFPVVMGSANFGSKSNRYIGCGDSIVF
jgi:7,8-dihydropterin-6-yl-methyl-4-(beta-D-ribofuranosyl)aminobenzene 5'-phosphate synthase